MHRRLAPLLAAGLVLLSACHNDPVAPQPPGDESALAALTADLARSAAAPDPFPAALRLTEEQRTRIMALTRQFLEATAADRAALDAALRRAAEARRNGQSPEAVRPILDAARPLHERIGAAHRQLQAAIEQVLTPAQRTWLAQQRDRCRPAPPPPLTSEQRSQIAALVREFEQANRADLDLVRATGEELRAAQAAGRGEAEIRAILERARPAFDRLAAAQRELLARTEQVAPRPAPPPACRPGIG